MARYLIDANLPYRFSLWHGGDYLHVWDLNDEWTDSEIWAYARDHDLTIVSKDADFSDRSLVSQPPPRVIHVRVGNLRMQELHQALTNAWTAVCELSNHCRLVRVFLDRIEGIE